MPLIVSQAEGWLTPLVARIHDDPTRVVVPNIRGFNLDSLELMGGEPWFVKVHGGPPSPRLSDGGFWWRTLMGAPLHPSPSPSRSPARALSLLSPLSSLLSLLSPLSPLSLFRSLSGIAISFSVSAPAATPQPYHGRRPKQPSRVLSQGGVLIVFFAYSGGHE